MPSYLSPGVYVEEPPPKARPIAGVGTSTAAFLGVAAASTPSAPTLITSWEEFKSNFGDPATAGAGNKVLALAVYGFFNNGGKTCWVLRSDMSDLATDLAKLAPIDEIAIVAAPGANTKAQYDALADHCESLKDRFAVLDGKNVATLTPAAINDGSTGKKFAGMYFPYIKVLDPETKTLISQPPSGHVAGIYARVDFERGVFKAPANEDVRGAVSLDMRLTRDQQDLLNPKGINVIRSFEGAIRVYGARTLGGDDNGDMKYVSTRRYMNFLRESIDEGMQFVVFEPNAPPLWQRIIRSASGFLYNQWREGGLFGETEKQAFFVKCDAETNPPSVREEGKVITEIGVAIVKPAEFVIFRIEQTSGT